MDNVTHTLVGVLVGEAASSILPHRTNGSTFQQRRNLCVFVMGVGSSLPDADLLHTLIAGGRLNYLLHHRGYTHTVIGALVASVAMFAACHVWWRWRRVTAENRAAVAGVAFLAPLLHIAMDATNSYGVHPFWPFHNGWLYGDSVFIIEPLFWAAAAPLVFVLRTALARALVGAVLLAGAALSFLVGMVPRPLGVFLVILMLGMLVTGKVTRARTAVLAGVACWLLTTAVFICAGQLAGHRAGERAGEDFPTATTLDRILSPMPVNPLCWELILAQQDGDAYVLRRAMLSLAPSWMPAADCPSRSLDARTDRTALTCQRPEPALAPVVRRVRHVWYRTGPAHSRALPGRGLHAFRSRALDCETGWRLVGWRPAVRPGAFRWLCGTRARANVPAMPLARAAMDTSAGGHSRALNPRFTCVVMWGRPSGLPERTDLQG